MASARYGGKARSMHADVPDAPLLLHLLQDGEVRRESALAVTMTRSILGTLNVANFVLHRRFHGGGVGLRGAGQDGARRWGPRRTGASSRRTCSESRARWQPCGRPAPRPAVQHVDDSAAVVDQRLEDLLRPRRLSDPCRAAAEADDREHLTGRRNGPLNERSRRLLMCAEQLRSERQRSAGAER